MSEILVSCENHSIKVTSKSKSNKGYSDNDYSLNSACKFKLGALNTTQESKVPSAHVFEIATGDGVTAKIIFGYSNPYLRSRVLSFMRESSYPRKHVCDSPLSVKF